MSSTTTSESTTISPPEKDLNKSRYISQERTSRARRSKAPYPPTFREPLVDCERKTSATNPEKFELGRSPRTNRHSNLPLAPPGAGAWTFLRRHTCFHHSHSSKVSTSPDGRQPSRSNILIGKKGKVSSRRSRFPRAKSYGKRIRSS